MSRHLATAVLFTVFSGTLFFSFSAEAQSTELPTRFDFVDVHVSPKVPNATMRSASARAGRWETFGATMLDFVRLGFGVDVDKIIGGPSWMELDRYDVIAKVSGESHTESRRPMLQAMLAERFSLVTHREDRPLPTYVLTAGKKPQMKEADGTGRAGCTPQSGGVQQQGSTTLFTSTNGVESRIVLGPGLTIQYLCRNMTMAAFAEGMRGMLGVSVGSNPVIDQTELKGIWNFDISFSLAFINGPDAGDRISLPDAVEKQLGLKLEQQMLPTPVLVVDSVNRLPTPNPPEVSKALPPVSPPTAFEVADVKLTDPANRNGRFQVQPGGRLVAQGMSMTTLLARAFNTVTTEQLVGLPKWAETERFDITAMAPESVITVVDNAFLAPMMKNLLEERFKLKTHTEERPMSAYTLLAVKPKLKKGDPNARSSCKSVQAPAGSPPGSVVVTCQNATMDLFADQLRFAGQGTGWPVLDATGLEGGWDFSVMYSRQAGALLNGGGGRGGEGAGGGDLLNAATPTGAVSISDAIEKQLGLKLDLQKRPMSVIVIDHIEQKPTDN